MSPEPSTAMPVTSLDELCINALRFLSVDAVQKANSGHPGLPPGAAVPGERAMRVYGVTIDNVCRRAVALLETPPGST